MMKPKSWPASLFAQTSERNCRTSQQSSEPSRRLNSAYGHVAIREKILLPPFRVSSNYSGDVECNSDSDYSIEACSDPSLENDIAATDPDEIILDAEARNIIENLHRSEQVGTLIAA